VETPLLVHHTDSDGGERVGFGMKLAGPKLPTVSRRGIKRVPVASIDLVGVLKVEKGVEADLQHLLVAGPDTGEVDVLHGHGIHNVERHIESSHIPGIRTAIGVEIGGHIVVQRRIRSVRLQVGGSRNSPPTRTITHTVEDRPLVHAVSELSLTGAAGAAVRPDHGRADIHSIRTGWVGPYAAVAPRAHTVSVDHVAGAITP
jgi:hypothetical protein